MTREFTTKSSEETVALGRELAKMLPPPKVVVLRGDLGAGKTTLVKGIAEGFQAASEEDVTSPTFTLIHEYRGPSATVYHIDLYRVDTQRELETLGLDDLMGEDSVLLIEWGEKFARFERERDVEIVLRRLGETERWVEVNSDSRGQASTNDKILEMSQTLEVVCDKCGTKRLVDFEPPPVHGARQVEPEFLPGHCIGDQERPIPGHIIKVR